MGKVYDALRKAEAQRTRGSAVPASVPARPELPGEVSVPGLAADRPHWLARIGRAMRRTSALPTGEGAAAINRRRIVLLHPESFVAEQFRSLRAHLDSLAAERPLRTVGLTSALPGEGKTTAAVSLALVTAMGVDRRVLLMDCDLRHPRVHTAVGLRPEAGLAEVLMGQVPLDRAIVKVDGTSLDVLAVRGKPANPSELLASSAMRELMEEVARRYDTVILDTAPTLALPDAKILSELADGFLLVIRADSTPQEDVLSALDVLDRRRVVGLVFNDAKTNESRYGY